MADISTEPEEASLHGIRVLDIGHQIAGPYCARLLADQGADVIKIERPRRGDSARALPPFVNDDGHLEKSLTFLYLNYNKRSVTLDLTIARGREVLLDLVTHSDILVENFEPAFLPSLGLDFKTLATVNPRLIVTSISNFGQTGARRDWRGNDLINYAVSGAMSISGTADREPLKHGQFQSAFVGGLAGVIPTLAAVYMREFTGEGQHADVSIAEALASTLVMSIPYYTYMGETQRRRDPAGSSYGNPAPAKDGWVIPHATRNREWADFCAIVNERRLLDPKYASSKGRITHAEELDRLLGEALLKLGRFELFHEANRKRLLCGVVQTPQDLANCEQLAARGFFHEIDHPVAGRLRYPGETFAASAGGFKVRRRPPLLGEHNEEVLGDLLGYGADTLRALAKEGVI
jgi:crotonobetainyl-CoA:carnitine CoA-transferase CaiB-like acyl-CoA transferase